MYATSSSLGLNLGTLFQSHINTKSGVTKCIHTPMIVWSKILTLAGSDRGVERWKVNYSWQKYSLGVNTSDINHNTVFKE
jgi:hypothetical protein